MSRITKNETSLLDIAESLTRHNQWMDTIRREIHQSNVYFERIAFSLEIIAKDIIERKKDTIRL